MQFHKLNESNINEITVDAILANCPTDQEAEVIDSISLSDIPENIDFHKVTKIVGDDYITGVVYPKLQGVKQEFADKIPVAQLMANVEITMRFNAETLTNGKWWIVEY